MFVVAALHTKRRPSTDIVKSSQAIERPRVAKAKQFQDPHRRLAPRVPQTRMTQIDHDGSACNHEASSHLPIKLRLGRLAPTRVRKFIPKPLVLVERMKSRQLLLELSSPFASEAGASHESSRRTMALAPPFPTHLTPTASRKLSFVLSSTSHSSSSVSFRVPSQNDVVFGNGFGQMRPRSRRRLSVATLGDNSASTDTFVADSPCFSKRASKLAVQVMEITTTNIHVNVEKRPSVGGVSLRFDSDLVASDLVCYTSNSGDAFEPGITSTPFGSGRADTSRTLSLTQLVPTVYPSRGWEQTFRADTSLVVASPTSRPMYRFNSHKGAYVVKLPSSRSTGSPLDRPSQPPSRTVPPHPPTQRDPLPVPLATQPKPALDFKGPLSRIASSPPTLVLDGVFALPHAPTPPLSPVSRRTSNALSRPCKPTPRRPLTNVSNAVLVAHHPLEPISLSSPTACGRQPGSESQPGPGPESPRSKLAHVLTAHVHPQTTTPVMRKPRRVPPPPVTEAQVLNIPRVQGLRIRKKAELARCDTSGSNNKGGDPNGGKGEVDAVGGKGAIERMACAGVGMVARLRARWERGTVEP
ncbi:hypothetical protein JVU11DRAFT_10509 [Chiua virens]|nr:hypothetical protein JVU11DRAFT_10509 [Chiua virens]